MSQENYIDVLHELATSGISSSGFTSPGEYLIWFFKQINGLFVKEENFDFANLQYFPIKKIHNEYINYGRLKDTPRLINLPDISNNALHKLDLEVFAFLLALTFVEEKPFGNIVSLLRTYRDKFIVEVIRENVSGRIERPVLFDEKNRQLTIVVPDYFDGAIAQNYFANILETTDKGIKVKLDNRLIVDDSNLVNAFEKVMTSEIKVKYFEEINNFFSRPDINKLTNEYKGVLETFNKKYSVKTDIKQLHQFTKMIFVHSWLKSMKYSYQISLAKFDNNNEPISFGVFLITSENKITVNKLNIFHIALNIAFNNISDFLNINGGDSRETVSRAKSVSFRQNKSQLELNTNDPVQFLYEDPFMRAIDYEIEKFARSEVPVLITGETGVGKDLIAYLLHKRSERRDKPYVRISINSLTESLLESELFGHVKGAFTGATETKTGKLERADSGTVYLPEISELSKSVQIKLLDFLQYKTVEPVGGGAEDKKKLNVRFIFASNEDLEKLKTEGKIREDFYYRIKVATIYVPPLRERKEDIELLANFFLEKYSLQMLGQKFHFNNGAVDYLKELEWKGNVRELENAIIRAIVVSDNNTITANAFKNSDHNGNSKVNGKTENLNYNKAEREFRKEYFRNILQQAAGNITKASRIAGISRQNFYRIIKGLEL